jgi:O-succinylbenzoic acid--CoA ligase
MAASCVVDWSSRDNEVLLNPRLPAAERDHLLRGLNEVEQFDGHVWVATSGSSGCLKWVALSKAGILASAQAVNEHLQSTSHDIWLKVLPVFHVGGLGIWARASLSGAQVVSSDGKWNPKQFAQYASDARATLTSLVPTQVFDLVSEGIPSSPELRAVIVGGGALNERVYRQALALGWKLLPSYGLTECSSQVATAGLNSWKKGQFPLLNPLNHMQLAIDEQGFLAIKSPALLTGYATSGPDGFRFIDPKIDGWLHTEDIPVLEDAAIKEIRRCEHFVKIGGESVDLLRLEMILEEILMQLPCDAALVPVPDDRLGHAIHLAVASGSDSDLNILAERFHQRVLPFERIRQIHTVPSIPRSPMKKIQRTKLLEFLT